jgi:hypothetical protein
MASLQNIKFEIDRRARGGKQNRNDCEADSDQSLHTHASAPGAPWNSQVRNKNRVQDTRHTPLCASLRLNSMRSRWRSRVQRSVRPQFLRMRLASSAHSALFLCDGDRPVHLQDPIRFGTLEWA